MPPDHTRRDVIVVLAGLVTLNLVTVELLDDAAQAVVQVTAALGAVVVAVRRGYSVDELGLSRRTLRAGLRLGAMLSAVVIVAVIVVAATSFTRGFLDDDRFVELSGWRFAYEVLVRIPVVTALSEELLFRSVLLAVMSKVMTNVRAVVASSVCFGLWHVLVTLGDLGGNATTDSLSTAGRIGGVVGVVVVTSVAGMAFAWTRSRSDSVAAPWLVHTALNGSTFVAGYVLAST